MNRRTQPQIRTLGDSALIVQLGREIDEGTNRFVHNLAGQVENGRLPGLDEVVPSYSSLTVHFDPLLTTAQHIAKSIRDLARSLSYEAEDKLPTILEIPVVYGGEYGPDLAGLSAMHGIDQSEAVKLHCGTSYRVYMLGFAPGFPYMGKVPDQIATPRLVTPRTLVPAGSVGIAGSQTGIYPVATPGGWQIIGRTPVRLFDPHRQPPSLLSPGNQVRFREIDESEYLLLLKAVKTGGGSGTGR